MQAGMENQIQETTRHRIMNHDSLKQQEAPPIPVQATGHANTNLLKDQLSINALCGIAIGHQGVKLLIDVTAEANNANVINANGANVASDSHGVNANVSKLAGEPRR